MYFLSEGSGGSVTTVILNLLFSNVYFAVRKTRRHPLPSVKKLKHSIYWPYTLLTHSPCSRLFTTI